MFFKIVLLLVVSSCALFKGASSLENKDPDELLDLVRITGEGRGRLALGQSNYVFSVDSVMKDTDWILAVSIPLHGEEVMILPDLKQKDVPNAETESFEQRIENELSRLNLKISGQEFMKELRSMVRFMTAPSLGLSRDCEEQRSGFLCQLEGETFLIEIEDKELSIKKPLDETSSLLLSASNLTDSFFSKSHILLVSNPKEEKAKTSPLSLELFW